MRSVVVAIGVTTLIAGCGGSGSASRARSALATTARSTRARAGISAPSTSCISTNGYGGLGASENAFDANNDNSTGPAEPTPGGAWYEVTGTEGGCTAAFSVQDSATPPLGAREMLVLVSRAYLPSDAKQVVSTNSCAVWKSVALGRALGVPYARAVAIGQVAGFPGAAQMQATSQSTC